MADDGLVVRGGAGGLSVAVDELVALAGVLGRVGEALDGQHPPAFVGRFTGAAWVARGRSEALLWRLLSLAARLRLAAATYAAADDQARQLVERARAPVEAAVRRALTEAAEHGLLDDGAAGECRLVGREVVRDAPPSTLAALLDAQESIAAAGPGRVRVVQVPQPDGGSAWLVSVPGTQSWSPVPGENPLDLTTDVQAVAHGEAQAAEQVARAVDQAFRAAGREGGAGRGDLVVLAGHSQGGILAVLAASSPALADRRVRVFTAGSPVGALPVPARVPVLSLEHDEDVVPRLDLIGNPDTRGHTTVRRRIEPERSRPVSPARAHSTQEYRRTAERLDSAPRGAHPSVDAWMLDAAPALAGSAFGAVTVREYQLTRLIRPTGPPHPTGSTGPTPERRWQNHGS